MKIIVINKENIELLKTFINNELPPSFRYFEKRDINCINNHFITIVGCINNIPIAYGHIDYENKYWLGICVLPKYHRKGYGKKIMNYLMDKVYNSDINIIYLSVDKTNDVAINMYKKYNFSIKDDKATYYIMSCDCITLPISLGEALDKLTILDIKLDKIKDNRRKDVKIEYDLLYSKLNKIVNEYTFYYSILKSVNLSIWEKQDIFRESMNDDIKTKLCKEIIIENDSRYRVKNKINHISNSSIKEQKGYKLKKTFILSHLGMGDIITSIGIVRYLSTQYDEVLVVCKNKNKQNMMEIYGDDNTIKILYVNNDDEISPKLGCNIEKYNDITSKYDTYLCGYHISKNPKIYDLPFCFYDDMNIPTQYFWEYFYVPTIKESIELYNVINNIKEYIFVHNTCSTGKVFNIEYIESKLNFNSNEVLIINPCYNTYNKGHKYYEIANNFINKSILSYKDIIINSNKIIVSDSSFMCLSINLEIKTNECYFYSRDNVDYSHIWSDKYIFNDNLSRKIFKNIKII